MPGILLGIVYAVEPQHCDLGGQRVVQNGSHGCIGGGYGLITTMGCDSGSGQATRLWFCVASVPAGRRGERSNRQPDVKPVADPGVQVGRHVRREVCTEYLAHPEPSPFVN